MVLEFDQDHDHDQDHDFGDSLWFVCGGERGGRFALEERGKREEGRERRPRAENTPFFFLNLCVLCVLCGLCVAEREGFEPPVPFGTTVFKTAAFDHSAISPVVRVEKLGKRKLVSKKIKAPAAPIRN